MIKKLAIILLFLVVSNKIMAQDSLTVISDSVVLEHSGGPDTVLLKSYANRYDPRKALLYAAVIPGLGQVYNKKYWKLPLVYGGFIGIGYAINFYQGTYKKYKVELFYNLDHGLINDADRKDVNDPNSYTTGNLRKIVDKARRERDFWTIMIGAMYLLQIVDAHVDAHLKEFDLNPHLKVYVQPSVSQDQMMGRQNGVSIILKF
jgi:hypothetical protein